jgi:hypothetical protein
MTIRNAFAAERRSDILEEAVLLQPAAEQLIVECAAPGPKNAELAQRGRRITNRYVALRDWLRHLPASAPRERVDRLIKEPASGVTRPRRVAARAVRSGLR